MVYLKATIAMTSMHVLQDYLLTAIFFKWDVSWLQDFY